FTFIEVMVATAVLSLGIVLIYKSFFISLNVLEHLTNRLYALVLLDNKIVDMQKQFETKKEIPFSDSPDTKTLSIDHRAVTFNFEKEVSSIGSLEGLYALNLGISWRESQGRNIHLSRQLLIGTYEQ